MSNPYIAFLNLIPKDARIIAKVLAVDTDGTVTAQIPGSNSNIIIRGDGGDTYVNGDYVFVVNGIITSKTPPLQTLATYEIL